MTAARVFIVALLVTAGSAAADTIVSYSLSGSSAGAGVVQPAFTGLVAADDYDPRTAAIGTDGDSNTISGFSIQNDNVYLRATGTLQSSLPGGGTNAWHTFGLSVTGLPANDVLDLTAVKFNYEATGNNSSTAFYFSVFSDAVGFDDLNDRLANGNFGGSVVPVTVDLTSANAVAGNAFTGLTNGADIEFRIYFGDDGSFDDDTSAIHRVRQFLTIEGETRTIPEPATAAVLALGAIALATTRRPR